MELSTSEPPGAGFDALYRATASDVFAYVMTLLRDRAAAEDVTAAAFERAFRRSSTFDARRGTRRAWLFGIARHAALDELRRRRRAAALLADPADPADPGAPAPAGEDEEVALRRAAVRTALAGMEARDRELIALKFHAGLSNAEIARVLGVSETNAGTRVHRAVSKLRKACHEPA
ncbi:sigma-70 family RNA polymerase sigma factor [Baekduia soli]|uniref:Sigma-70 family RNA polymerase sigma factor n=1 Tax=Baekduia soli TaxID=496014 RepID=A0A5B8U0R5_9ACTN|nr:sigma-70 family RNA polymerase sigma factor [Baekduia soli]QEC46581.1 sigma-70 family RNA polymerase sigma factor [Baekduia soli]